MSPAGEERLLRRDDATAEDAAAIRWAVSIGHRHRPMIAARARAGKGLVTAQELEEIRRGWEAAGRPPPERHVHRDAVVLADGSTITAMTFVSDAPYERDVVPAFGLYLDERWSPPWPHGKVEWPDFDVPADRHALRQALLDLLERSRTGATVELGCLGGHGRTGTALACLAVLAGTPSEDAVAWVRINYCPRAVETDEQDAFVRTFVQ